MTDFRLPPHIRPLRYAIDLNATPKKKSFSGVVTIDLKLLEASKDIVLNARGLKVQKAVVAPRSGKKQLGKVRADRTRECVEVKFAQPIAKGNATLTLTYTGTLDAAMHGLYLAKDGGLRALVSQCEATDARAIFPCFDEPEFKASLEWTVRTDPGLTVVTNGVLARVAKSKGQAVHVFKKTRAVSSYLAAVTIGPYETSAAFKVSATSCRVLSGPGKIEQTRFAQQVTRFVLPWYEEYFAQRYHYQKLDQVAVPGFDAGAMENIGAIFYRQSRLLMQPDATSWASEKSIAEVIAHEIAHQWFGNRVTMKWWDDLWLNEAFATWVSYKAIDAWRPDWRMWDDYQDEKESALVADALESTHAIYTPVRSPAEATELFDVITYSKGGAVLRMAEQFLGAQVFRNGIRRYMDAYKDANAAGADLWRKLEEASGEPVLAIMESWTQQPGFPLLRVSHDAGTLRLSQQRFFSNPEVSATKKQQWAMPIVIRYGQDGEVKEHRLVLRDEATSVSLGECDWICANAGSVGFYRTAYTPHLLAGLLANLNALSPAERMGLLEDQWALVMAAQSPINAFMETLSAFHREEDYAVVGAMAARLRSLHERLVSNADRPALAALASRLFAQQLHNLGWVPARDETQPTAVRRAEVVSVLGNVARDANVLEQCERLAERERAQPSAVEANLAGVVVPLAALRGDAARLDAHVAVFLERQKQNAAPEAQQRYLGSLALFIAPGLCSRVLALCLDGTVPQEQLRAVVVPLLGRRETQRETWAFLQKHWAEIGPRVGAMGISRLVEATGALPPELHGEVEAFFTAHPVPEAKRALQKALEAMTLRRALMAREGARLHEWLASHMSQRMEVSADAR
jgi:puromycin-sensitive aminopeptidase